MKGMQEFAPISEVPMERGNDKRTSVLLVLFIVLCAALLVWFITIALFRGDIPGQAPWTEEDFLEQLNKTSDLPPTDLRMSEEDLQESLNKTSDLLPSDPGMTKEEIQGSLNKTSDSPPTILYRSGQ